MFNFFKSLAIIILIFVGSITNNAVASTTSGNVKQKSIEKIKKAIVTINSRVSLSAYKNTGNWSGTGFIVNQEHGLLMTNTHVVGRGAVGTYFVTFHNGKQAEAKAIYYDAYADFAVLQVAPNELPDDIDYIKFSKKTPDLGDEVFIVGNTESQGFSVHNGYLSDLFEINGEMPQGSFVINMNTTGGASGSPIINAENKAIGILYGGGKTHALALKQSYLEHALKALIENELPKRQQIGIITNLYSLDKAVKHRHFPKSKMEQYLKKYPNSRNRAITIRTVLNGSPAENILQQGDIIWEINDTEVAADLALFDQIMNKSGSKVRLTIYRNGKKFEKEINTYDLNKQKVTKMFDFAGALFFEVDDFVSHISGARLGSVAAANVQTGSSFSSISEMYVQDYKSVYRIIINELNNKKVDNLENLIKISKEAVQKKHISVIYTNYQPYRPEFNGEVMFNSAHEMLVQDITFDSIDTKPRILQFNKNTYEWVANDL